MTDDDLERENAERDLRIVDGLVAAGFARGEAAVPRDDVVRLTLRLFDGDLAAMDPDVFGKDDPGESWWETLTVLNRDVSTLPLRIDTESVRRITDARDEALIEELLRSYETPEPPTGPLHERLNWCGHHAGRAERAEQVLDVLSRTEEAEDDRRGGRVMEIRARALRALGRKRDAYETIRDARRYEMRLRNLEAAADHVLREAEWAVEDGDAAHAAEALDAAISVLANLRSWPVDQSGVAPLAFDPERVYGVTVEILTVYEQRAARLRLAADALNDGAA